MLSQRMIVCRRVFPSWSGFIKNKFLQVSKLFQITEPTLKTKIVDADLSLTDYRKIFAIVNGSTASKTISTQNCSRFVFIFRDLGPRNVLQL